MNALEQAQEKLDSLIKRREDVLFKLNEQKNKLDEQIIHITRTFNLSIEANQQIVDEIKLKFYS